MRHLLLTTMATSALATLAPGARAATITSTAPVATTELVPLGADIFVSPFNPALGTLTGVSVSLTGQFTPGLTLTNPPAAPLPPAQFDPRVTLNKVSSIPPSGMVPFQDISLERLPGAETVPFVTSGRQQTALGTPEAIDITTALSLTSSRVQFAGSDRLDFYITGRSNVTNGSLYTSYGPIDNAVLNGQLAVTYTYTPASGGGGSGAAVPEPESLALLGAGLLGLGLTRRRLN